jgi:hypothetical protein
MRRFLPLLSLAVFGFSCVLSYGDTVSIGAVPTFQLNPLNDFLTLNSVTGDFSGSTSITQTGVFAVGNTPGVSGIFNYSLLDPVTVNGITKNITINFLNNTTQPQDFLMFSATGSTTFGDLSLSFRPFTSLAEPVGGSAPISLIADITSSSVAPTPEPGSFGLLGTGLIGMIGAVRRRYQKASGSHS